jgi:hypothetical protein
VFLTYDDRLFEFLNSGESFGMARRMPAGPHFVSSESSHRRVERAVFGGRASEGQRGYVLTSCYVPLAYVRRWVVGLLSFFSVLHFFAVYFIYYFTGK